MSPPGPGIRRKYGKLKVGNDGALGSGYLRAFHDEKSIQNGTPSNLPPVTPRIDITLNECEMEVEVSEYLFQAFYDYLQSESWEPGS